MGNLVQVKICVSFIIYVVLQIDGVVRLDNWINLDMDPMLASQIVSLRPALESLVIKASKEPEQVLEMSPLDMKVCFG